MLDEIIPGAPKRGFTPVHVPPATKEMPLWRVAQAARRNMLETIPALAYRQPMVSGRTVARWHMVMDPAALKRVFLDNVENYPKSNVTQRLLRPAIGESIFTSEGDEWKWQRRAAAPIFNHRKMTALAPMMTAAAQRTSERFSAAQHNGFEGAGVACVMEEMVTATFEVVCDALLAGGEAAGAALDRRRIGDAITRYLDTIGRISFLDIVGAPNWIPRPSQVLNRGVMNATTQMIDQLIAARRKAYEAGERRDDLMDYLIAAQDPDTQRSMDDVTLRNNLISFIVAGHETTALALAWALYLLANDREIQDRAAQEARSALGEGPAFVEHLPKLGYVRQILDEAMRLFPPAAILSRQAQQPDVLCGREVRKDDLVIIPIYTLHRHFDHWENPNMFDPEHFAPEKVKSRSRYTYIPFGAGPRVCIGMNFSLMEAQIILATLLARHEFAPKPGRAPEPILTMTLRPKGGMPLIVRDRPT